MGNYSQHYSKAFKAKEKREQQVERQKEKEEIRKDVPGNNLEEIDTLLTMKTMKIIISRQRKQGNRTQ